MAFLLPEIKIRKGIIIVMEKTLSTQEKFTPLKNIIVDSKAYKFDCQFMNFKTQQTIGVQELLNSFEQDLRQKIRLEKAVEEAKLSIETTDPSIADFLKARALEKILEVFENNE